MSEGQYGIKRRGLHAEYSAYINMIHRCTNPQHKVYSRYGGRGITVDPLWLQSFDYFYLDMGRRPPGDGTRKGEYTLDRSDPDGPYTKENCRWLVRTEKPRKVNIRMGARRYDIDRRKLRAEYCCYVNMIHRCTNPNHKAYAKYGGSGITVDPLWLQSFDYFYLDMGYRPVGDGTRKGEFSLDRVDPFGPYTKENCRWATRTQQQRNQRTNIHVVYQGKSMILSELAELVGMNAATIGARLNRGLTMEQAIDPTRLPTGRKAQNIRKAQEKS